MTPIKQVVFRRNGTLYMTSEINYNRRIPNVSELLRLEGFKTYDEVAEYMWKWKQIPRDYLLDKISEEVW